MVGGRQSKLDFNITSENINPEEENHFFNLDEYYKEKDLKKVNNSNLNKEDYRLHLEAIKSINNSIWKKNVD